MTRCTVFADIAGRTSKGTAGSPRVTSAAVAIPTSELASVRSRLRDLPKWGRCTVSDAESVAEILATEATAIAIISMNKDTPEWHQFCIDGDLLNSTIASESWISAGWAKAPVILTFDLLSRACFMVTVHAISTSPRNRMPYSQGIEFFEFSIICDADVSGNENIEIFKSFWDDDHIPKEKLAVLGLQIIHPEVLLTTEQSEPLLLLADYAAGLGHSAHMPDPGRLPIPISCEDSAALLQSINYNGKLLVEAVDFDTSYEEIFGDVMQEARRRRAG